MVNELNTRLDKPIKSILMKANIYILVIFISMYLSACKSIEKMVEKGQYDAAMEFAVSKLAGNKNKDTKYVKALETAYQRLNARDLSEVKKLSIRGSANDWQNIFRIYNNLEQRQALVAPLVPLVSKDGYSAEFVFDDYSKEINQAALTSADKYYDDVLVLIDRSEKFDDKRAARQAFEKLNRINALVSNYKDSYELERKARELGIYYIGLDIDNNRLGQYSEIIDGQLEQINLNKLNSDWVKYAFVHRNDRVFDKYVVVKLNDIDFQPERERVSNYELKSTVQDGYNVAKDKYGKVLVDSLGHQINLPKFVDVFVYVTEVFREKFSSLHADIVVYDNKQAYALHTIPVEVSHRFNDSAVRFVGDNRALNSDISHRLDDHLSFFPSNYDAINKMSLDLVNVVECKVKELEREYLN